MSDPASGQFGPAIGKAVVVDVDIHLGTAAGDPADGYPPAPSNSFTGTYTMTPMMISDVYSSFDWTVSTADEASSLDPANEYTAGSVDFVHGHPTGFFLSHLGDPDGHTISNHSWSFDFGESPAMWGGTWQPDSIASSTPEPSSWAFLVAGFGLVGVAVRRRRLGEGYDWRMTTV
ncbi:PEPxxWA-CTERM sorting domain-containing protein [Polymorphobacter sp. PAMC 29334]|uniref:PEPxxWA-CTERM sorting domain-containing protein n=1 Tax=Polymorphobacter sp. PAMC 29334 TaxID=2862331 RepID=UPI001D0255E5|nr:PEPxxWA-CTERM sorting domain-containing protein [Polymorphobacter sp. PAMC 29334]